VVGWAGLGGQEAVHRLLVREVVQGLLGVNAAQNRFDKIGESTIYEIFPALSWKLMAMDFHAMHSFPGMAGCSNEMFIDGDDKELDDEDPLGQFETRGGDKIPTYQRVSKCH